MDKVKNCIFCESTDIKDRGVYYSTSDQTALREYRCRRCDGRWQYNATFEVDWDDKPQVLRDPNITEHWTKQQAHHQPRGLSDDPDVWWTENEDS